MRKDKVFKVPYVAPSSWKGALHAAMVQRLVEEASTLNTDRFAAKRFQLTLLFGDEKGEEGIKTTNLAKFLDEVENKKGAAEIYRKKVKDYFGVEISQFILSKGLILAPIILTVSFLCLFMLSGILERRK